MEMGDITIMKVLDRQKILDFMTLRKYALDEQIIKDFTGGVQSRVFEERELKYWKEAIERGEFDTSIEEVYVILSKTQPEIVDFTFYVEKEAVEARIEELNTIAKGTEFWYLTMYSSHRNSENLGKGRITCG
jgi:hypothetical protein